MMNLTDSAMCSAQDACNCFMLCDPILALCENPFSLSALSIMTLCGIEKGASAFGRVFKLIKNGNGYLANFLYRSIYSNKTNEYNENMKKNLENIREINLKEICKSAGISLVCVGIPALLVGGLFYIEDGCIESCLEKIS